MSRRYETTCPELTGRFIPFFILRQQGILGGKHVIDEAKSVEESKNRCQNLGLNPKKKQLTAILTSKELAEKQKNNYFLIHAALPYMTLIAETFKECGSLLALVDNECYILKLVGPANVRHNRRKFGLVEGTSLREEDAGTNAVTLCLNAKKPFRIAGKQYFLELFQTGSCFAAPIIEGNRLLGAVVIIHPKKGNHPHTFALVQSLAKLICREYREITQGSFIISVCDSLNTGVVLTEKQGAVWYANLRARHILRIKKGDDIVDHFDAEIFSSARLNNEILYSQNVQRSFLVTRKAYHDKFLFLFEPLEEELRKEEKIKATLAPYNFKDIIGLGNIKKKAQHLAMQRVNLLIIGESGTGKELFASAVHNASPRAGAPFIVVNCAAIPETLFESELFGYRKGAFTDARCDRIGKIEYASGGTLFLDEIADLPLTIQSKLLRVIEDKCVTPLGGNDTKNVDVRFIFATNRDLNKLIEQKKFREDLYYRIHSPMIKIPPLRERKHEIPDFIDYFIQKTRSDYTRFVAGIADETIAKLMEYHYPGNVRELQGILTNAFLTCQGEKIETNDIEIPQEYDSFYLKDQLAICAERIIKERLSINNNDIKITARELKISPRTIYRYLKR